MLTLHWVHFLINWVFGFIEGIIALRIVLKMFGANSAAPFINWIYETSQPLLSPFLGAFPSPRLESGFIIEVSALIGLVVYAFIGYYLSELIRRVEYQQEREEVVESRAKRRK